MPQHQIQVQQFFAAPRERVFRYFADHKQFGRLWWPARCRVLKLASSTEPFGVGSVRQIRVGAMRFEETITAFKPDRSIEYRVTRGGPFRNHLGRMEFIDVPGGTQLDYRIEFDSRWPMFGQFVARSLHRSWRRGVRDAIDRLISTQS